MTRRELNAFRRVARAFCRALGDLTPDQLARINPDRFALDLRSFALGMSDLVTEMPSELARDTSGDQFTILARLRRPIRRRALAS